MSTAVVKPPEQLRTCDRCGLPVRPGKEHDYPEQCVSAYKRTTALIIEKIGTPRSCRACGALIYMITTNDGKVKPYDPSLTSHFLTCPNASEFYSKKGKSNE